MWEAIKAGGTGAEEAPFEGHAAHVEAEVRTAGAGLEAWAPRRRRGPSAGRSLDFGVGMAEWRRGRRGGAAEGPRRS